MSSPLQPLNDVQGLQHAIDSSRQGRTPMVHGPLVTIGLGEGRQVTICRCGHYGERFDGDVSPFRCGRAWAEGQVATEVRRSAELQRELDRFLAGQ